MTFNGDWWLELNNYCQTNRLAWSKEERQTGPQAHPTWTIYVYINGVEYGRGSGLSKSSARQEAAQRALRVLQPHLVG
ncbi:hypothetical protein PYCCODRAFT_1441045 [Trametes coccinea BRFM310]|uniref:DRBM domain-containing protein n=1 Tax=Trametes coccinea (strain BRFM310) TaxID=1353009 RepID=A0A1Y2I5Q9_TRAC3|nr:hypothetical protein PYCCODRAFT_1441045 [Trametes coccinea BRFM310]